MSEPIPPVPEAGAPPVHRRYLHAALSPVYLAVVVLVGALLMGLSPAGAGLAGLAALVASILPVAVVLAGWKFESRRLVRAALLVLVVEIVALGLLFSPGRTQDFGVLKLDETAARARMSHAADLVPEIKRLALEIDQCGPRATGSEGLARTLKLVEAELAKHGWTGNANGNPDDLAAPPAAKTIRRTEFPVLVPRDAGSHVRIYPGPQEDHSPPKPEARRPTPAYALMPNAIQPCATPKEGLDGELVYLGRGADADWDGKAVDGKLAVFEFASNDAWLKAYERGARGAIFLEEPDERDETVRQADQKYLALVPLNFPRVYVADEQHTGLPGAQGMRSAAMRGERANLKCDMRLETINTPVLEAFIPGTQTEREMLVFCHADACSIAPSLSFGGQEGFSIAAWLALFDYYAAHPPAFSLRFVLTTGHWQAQAAGRAYAYAVKDAVGSRIAMSMGVALDPETEALILTDETVAESVRPSQYWWLKKLLFTVDRREPGWIDQLEALSARPVLDRGDTPSKYSFFSGRPTIPGSNWSLWLAPVDEWPPLSHSIGFPTANQAMHQDAAMSVAFVTCGGYRLRHFTCQDRIDPWLKKTENLRPQLELTFALVGALADLDPKRFPEYPAEAHREYGGYNVADVQVLNWNPGILWYDKVRPKNTRTFVALVPTDTRFQRGRNNAYWPRVLAPNRHTHRQLQCLMTAYFAEADENGRVRLPNVYAPFPEASYNALAYSLDDAGRITHAFDQGFHGDMEFHFLEHRFNSARVLFQVPLFECGAVAIPGLVDHNRLNIGAQVESEYRMQWGVGNDQDDGEIPWLPVREVNEVTTHTTADAYSWVQYRDVAMVFLKANQRCEIRAGSPARLQALFNDDPLLRTRLLKEAARDGLAPGAALAKLDQQGSSVPVLSAASRSTELPDYLGFRVEAGEERRLSGTAQLSLSQLAKVTHKRLDEYASVNVRSPTADMYQSRAEALLARAAEQRKSGHTAEAEASETLAWANQAQAYSSAYRLLVDVVTTTIFYFLLLLPFGFLAERLLFPQASLIRTCLVAAALFMLFSGLLYFFHPGFRLASNVFVTLVTFVIVILTLPALLIVAGRGLALLMEPGARFKKRHSADAETWGVLAAALSLAVSNMRRRKLRTGLTLATITLLVMSLVLLTSTAASTQFYRERQAVLDVPYQGIQVMNTHDHTHGMNEQSAALIRALYGHEARVVERRAFNPGFEATISCYVVPAPEAGVAAQESPKRFTVRGAGTLEPEERDISGLHKTISAGRFFEPGDEFACLLSEDTAKSNKLSVGDTVRFLGQDLKLVGLLKPTLVDAGILDVSGKPLTPQAFYRQALNVDSPDHMNAKETLFVPGALLRRGLAAPFPVFSVVLVPNASKAEDIAARATELTGLKTLAEAERLGTLEERLVRAAKGSLNVAEAARLAEGLDAAQLQELAAFNLKRRTFKRIGEEIAAQLANVDVYLTDPAPTWLPKSADRVDLLSAFARVSLQSGSFLILPFAISFFMLLAIMIGNVYERRQEIHVFSSVGLSPRHVAGMFLAEALVYAGIASVLGYFLGIILLDLFRRAGWLPPDFHANYFGKAVIWSAALATGSSLLSVIYPMRVAAMMVNPSLERIWRIESEPKGDHWIIALPFVAHERDEALGMLEFAREFLEHHRGERTGAFATEGPPLLAQPDSVPVLSASVWLSPFERNLIQSISIVPRHDAQKERYHFDLQVTRVSGPEYLWRKSNHAFVDGLRKQMLIWRSLESEQIYEYARAGEASIQRGRMSADSFRATAAPAASGGPA